MPKVAKPRPILSAPRDAKAAPVTKTETKRRPSTQPRSPGTSAGAGGASSRSHSAWRCASVIDQQAAEAVSRLLRASETRRGGVTLKSLTLAPHVVHKRPTHAVTCETLRHLALLQRVLAAAGLPDALGGRLVPAVAYVLTYELLLGQGLRSKGPAERALCSRKAELQAALQAELDRLGVQDAAAWLVLHAAEQPGKQQHHEAAQQPMFPHPRHARVNILKASVADVLQRLQTAADAADGGSGGRALTSALPRPVVDKLLPDVLEFLPGTDLHAHPLVREGVLLLQSKASCMPAHALQPQAGWHIVDCCAAPGNKTTHVAALLHAACAAAQNAAAPVAPRVFAFDRDAARLERLRANVKRTGAADIVTACCADFLSIDPEAPEYAQVQGVLLDPSCSGSGTIISRMDHLLPGGGGSSSHGGGGSAHGGQLPPEEEQRVEQLARFQEAALRHALRFPALRRLVYSTCSVHQRENEDVVAAVLPDAVAAGFALVEPFPGCTWHRRGVPGSVPGAELLVRVDPLQDATDGFFVAVLERQGTTKAQSRQSRKRAPGKSQKHTAAQAAA